jgi:hypothetical protein
VQQIEFVIGNSGRYGYSRRFGAGRQSANFDRLLSRRWPIGIDPFAILILVFVQRLTSRGARDDKDGDGQGKACCRRIVPQAACWTSR